MIRQAQLKICKLKECGGQFIPLKGRAKRNYCSPECAVRANYLNAVISNRRINKYKSEHAKTIKLHSGLSVLNNVIGQFMARGDGMKEYYKER